MSYHNKIHPKRYAAAPIKIAIKLTDNTTATNVVDKWEPGNERSRMYMFRRAKDLLHNFKKGPIAVANFYDKENGGVKVGHMDKHGTFHGGVAFMNYL